MLLDSTKLCPSQESDSSANYDKINLVGVGMQIVMVNPLH